MNEPKRRPEMVDILDEHPDLLLFEFREELLLLAASVVEIDANPKVTWRTVTHSRWAAWAFMFGKAGVVLPGPAAFIAAYGPVPSKAGVR